VTVLWWRSVGHTHTAFVAESVVDELAALAGKDPVAFRLDLLTERPRHQAVLKKAAEMAGWGRKLPAGTGLGVAVHGSFGSVVAEVAQVKVENGSYRVEKVWCAVDCGIAVNPDIVKAQMEGGIGYGLSALLREQIVIREGQVTASNFHDYAPLRMSEMPEVEVAIMPSDADPSGVGEPGLPPLAPAVANAIAAVTGKRLRELPLRLEA
jgi:isoquinoline 1-oxidoreductase beta subunit